MKCAWKVLIEVKSSHMAKDAAPALLITNGKGVSIHGETPLHSLRRNFDGYYTSLLMDYYLQKLKLLLMFTCYAGNMTNFF